MWSQLIYPKSAVSYLVGVWGCPFWRGKYPFCYNASWTHRFYQRVLSAYYFGNITYPSRDPPKVGFLSTVPNNARDLMKDAVDTASMLGGFPSQSCLRNMMLAFSYFYVYRCAADGPYNRAFGYIGGCSWCATSNLFIKICIVSHIWWDLQSHLHCDDVLLVHDRHICLDSVQLRQLPSNKEILNVGNITMILFHIPRLKMAWVCTILWGTMCCSRKKCTALSYLKVPITWTMDRPWTTFGWTLEFASNRFRKQCYPSRRLQFKNLCWRREVEDDELKLKLKYPRGATNPHILCVWSSDVLTYSRHLTAMGFTA